ncbi:MAG: hypothetical protein JSV89_12150 [Spirochaetaceae bacterium]|nr:MAG: hypothetical protein JSV89_12150 [Spirochaetaceae bacterium]
MIIERLVLLLLASILVACTSIPPTTPNSAAGRHRELSEAGPGGGNEIPQRPGDAQGSYRILKEGRHNQVNWLELNEYFLIHHIYADIFQRFDLHRRFSVLDKIKIFAGLLYNLDFETPVNLVIDNFKDTAALRVSLQLIQIGDSLSVLLATNTDREGTTLYVGVENMAKTYKRSYLIVDNQLIAVPDLYSQSKETALIEENRADKLARFYIFDGNTNNDTVAEGLLIGSIREAKTVLERSNSELILCRYYISQNRLVEAQALLLAVGNLLDHVDGDAGMAEAYAITYEELLITKALREHAQSMRENQPKSL